MTVPTADVVFGVAVNVALVGIAVVGVVVLTRRGAGRGTVPSVVGLTGVGVALVLFAGYAGVVDAAVDRASFARIDPPVLAWMVANRSGPVTAVAVLVSTVGGTVGSAVVAGCTAAVLIVRRRIYCAVIVVIAQVGAGILISAFKVLNGRARPPVATRLVVETTLSLPSGHALGAIVAVGMVVAVVFSSCARPRHVALRLITVGVGAVVVITIGLSRLYLGVHWATDVLAGWLLGGAWLALCAAVLTSVASGQRAGEDRVRGPGVASPPGDLTSNSED